MMNANQKERLMKNWGESADSLQCNAEMRLYDPLSPWECYLYAMNPVDENEVCVIISHGFPQKAIIQPWTLNEIDQLYNSDGEKVQIDEEYRPRAVEHIIKRINRP